MPVQISPKSKSKLVVLRDEGLDQIAWLAHGFSTRTGGTSRVYGGNALNLGITKEDSHAAVERNRDTFLLKIGAAKEKKALPLITLRQIHSDLIHCVSEVPVRHLSGDGLVTQTPDVALGIQTADCIPVILVDTKRKVIGVFHAGWRGTVKRIVEKGVGEMRRCFGARARDIHAAIGPGIHNCCYQVGQEVRDKFESQFGYAADLFHETKESDEVREKYPLLFLTARAPGHSELPKRIFLDLVEANRRQLIEVGVLRKNIKTSELCTACRPDLFFSHRADRGVTGRMLAVAAIR